MSYGLRTGNPIDKRLFEIWRHMHARCENPKHPAFKNYGERGIRVCEEWNSFVMFGAWAISNGYAPELSVDRIDVNGNYEPSNCRWATRKVQANNKRNSLPVVIGDEVKSFSVRKRTSKWEYRIELAPVDGKRRQVSKSGFATRDEAIAAGEETIKTKRIVCPRKAAI